MIARRRYTHALAAVFAAVLGVAPVAAPARAQSAGAPPASGAPPAGAIAHELARKVANPLASLVSIPIQWNVDGGIGPFDASRTTLNLQPVVPVSLGPEATVRLISRTVLPVVWAEGGPTLADVSGIGDVTQSVFVTNARPTRNGWTLGLGPVVQMPTGSDARLTSNGWSVGPTAIAVRQVGPWTYGAMANHLWSADSDGQDVSTTFVQPFVNYLAHTHTTFALNTEATHDAISGTWSVPVHVIVNQLLKVGPQPMSVFVGVRWWADAPDDGPEGLGWRAGTTLLFPTSRPGGPGAHR